MTSNSIEKFVVVGDRVLIRPKSSTERTRSGLFLPPGVEEKEKIQSGYVVKTGPGYAVAPAPEVDEPWKEHTKAPQYIPLQATIGDLAIYIQGSSYEIEYEQTKYVIVPQSAILLLIRENESYL